MPKCKFAIPHYPDRMDVYEDSSSDGNPKPIFTTVRVTSMPGNIMTVGGDETFRGQQLEAKLTHVVETPWRDNLDASLRMTVVGGIYDARILNVESARPIRKEGRMPYILLFCRELEL